MVAPLVGAALLIGIPGCEQSEAPGNLDGNGQPEQLPDDGVDNLPSTSPDGDISLRREFHDPDVPDDIVKQVTDQVNDPQQRRDVVERMGSQSGLEPLHKMNDEYGPTVVAVRFGDDDQSVVLIEEFDHPDPEWLLPSACPGHLGDPPLTGMAWTIDLEQQRIESITPVYGDNIC